jgi:predicted HD superfamily hydrolase involved in NAD metabolism
VSAARRPDPAAIKAWLAGAMDAKRYAHVAGTAQLAAELAVRAGVSPERACLAGWLHDCARALAPAQQAAILAKYHGRFLDAAVRAYPSLWHNPASVYLAVHKFGVTDSGVLRAIGRHSTGSPGMHTLDKVIYVADYCEPGRKQADARPLRALARENLDAAFRRIVRAKLAYLRAHGISPHPLSLALAREMDRMRKNKTSRRKKVTPGFKENHCR